MVDISFDSAKSEKNVLVRGVPFELAAEFAWDGALIVEDLRKDYGERRFQALGLLGDRLHMMGFHATRQQGPCELRLISQTLRLGGMMISEVSDGKAIFHNRVQGGSG
jgi:uncharacterized DUF497 family protein